MQPDDSSSVSKQGEECHEPNGVFNAFTFMNFALAGATLGIYRWPITIIMIYGSTHRDLDTWSLNSMGNFGFLKLKEISKNPRIII